MGQSGFRVQDSFSTVSSGFDHSSGFDQSSSRPRSGFRTARCRLIPRNPAPIRNPVPSASGLTPPPVTPALRRGPASVAAGNRHACRSIALQSDATACGERCGPETPEVDPACGKGPDPVSGRQCLAGRSPRTGNHRPGASAEEGGGNLAPHTPGDPVLPRTTPATPCRAPSTKVDGQPTVDARHDTRSRGDQAPPAGIPVRVRQPRSRRIFQAALRNSSRLQISTSACVSSRIIAASCAGPGVKRSRSVPRGTVG